MAHKLSWFLTDHVGVLLPKIKKIPKIPTDGWLSQHRLGFLSTNPFHRRFLLPTGLPHDNGTLIILFLVLRFNFLFVPCGRLSWLPVSFLLRVKYTLSYHENTINSQLWGSGSQRTKSHEAEDRFGVELGRYIVNIVDISPISIYWYRYRIGTLHISFFRIYRYRIDDNWNIDNFSIFYHTFPTFERQFKDRQLHNYMRINWVSY